MANSIAIVLEPLRMYLLRGALGCNWELSKGEASTVQLVDRFILVVFLGAIFGLEEDMLVCFLLKVMAADFVKEL